MVNRRGFSLIEILIATGILSIFSVVVVMATATMIKRNEYLGVRAIAQGLKENIIGVMENDKAILMTAQDTLYNTSSRFSCILSGTDCSSLISTDNFFCIKNSR